MGAGGVEKDVTFADADRDLADEIDAAYGAKHRRYAASIIDSIVSPAGARGDAQARAARHTLVPDST